jgi:hypothetical protein
MIFRCSKLPWISPWLHQDKRFGTSIADGIWVDSFCSLFVFEIFYEAFVQGSGCRQYAKVTLPSPTEVEHYKEIILQNFPDLNGVWCIDKF